MAPMIDDSTVVLQVQQFLDEWHFRVLHSQVATDMNRNTALDIALSMFELHIGQGIPTDARAVLADMDDPEIVQYLVALMSPESKMTFEHFALQLQLIVSSTTRVRRALEDNDEEEVVSSMESSESTGISQQILKLAVVQAGVDVSGLKVRQETWTKNMESRVSRLGRATDDAERLQSELMHVQNQLAEFGGSQNKKAKGVLMSMASGQDKALMNGCFNAWEGWMVKIRGEKEIRDKFEAQIARAEQQLLEYKEKQLSNVKGVLMRKAADGDMGLLGEIIQLWTGVIVERKKEEEVQAGLAMVQNKLSAYKSAQAENTKKVMSRMSAGSDTALMGLCFQAWQKSLEELRREAEMDEKVKQAEAQVQAFLKKKSEEAKGVLDRMSGASDTGLLHNVVTAWKGVLEEEKKAKEMEEQLKNGGGKFGSLNARRGAAAKGCMGRVSHMQEFIFLLPFFANWAMDAKVEATLAHYNSKIDQKKNQLQSVQQMFRGFANQLEAGLQDSVKDSAKPSQRRSEEGAAA